MKTERLPGYKITDSGISRAAQIVRQGGIVGIPTETVYGLAANAYDVEAVKKVFIAKGRPQDNPLIVHVSDMDMLREVVSELPATAVTLARKYWPGPLTMVLPKSAKIPDEITAGLDTVAVRMPSNEIAREFIRLSGVPIAAPSANTSGRPSPTTAQHVLDDLDGKIDAVIMSDECEVGVESTVVLLANGANRLLRPGAVTPEQLSAVIGDISIDKSVLSSEVSAKVSSPGMKYKHYSPSTKVVMLVGDSDKYADYVNASDRKKVAVCFYEDAQKLNCDKIVYGKNDDPGSLAHGIFDALRRVDTFGADVAFVHSPEKSGVGLAVYNRLLRAAAFEVIEL